jgi:hypothetical protein
MCEDCEFVSKTLKHSGHNVLLSGPVDMTGQNNCVTLNQTIIAETDNRYRSGLLTYEYTNDFVTVR